MVSNWEPGTQYDYGAIVEYERECPRYFYMLFRRKTIYFQKTHTRSSNLIALRYIFRAVYPYMHTQRLDLYEERLDARSDSRSVGLDAEGIWERP